MTVKLFFKRLFCRHTWDAWDLSTKNYYCVREYCTKCGKKEKYFPILKKPGVSDDEIFDS